MSLSSFRRPWFALAFLLTLPCLAAVNGTDVLVPTGGNLRTTLSVTNPSTFETAQLQIQLLAAGASNGVPQAIEVSLAPAQTVVYENIAEALFQAKDARGAMRVHANRNVLISSRVFTRRHDSDPAWHARTIVPVQERSGLAHGGSAVVNGLRSTAGFRYDLVLFETAGASSVVRLELRDGNGIRMGERMLTLAPWEEQTLSARDILGATNLTEGSVLVEVTDGEGRVVVSGSLIAETFEELAEFPMSVLSNPTFGPGEIARRPDERRLGVFDSVVQVDPAGSLPGGAFRATSARRPVGNVAFFTGSAQLMNQTDGALVFGDSTSYAAYLVRAGVHSNSVPGAPLVAVSEPNVFAVRTDGGLVAKAQNYNVAGGHLAIPATGEGARLMWYPYKAAFRGGTLSAGAASTRWDDSDVGFFSWAGGRDTKAGGQGSFAFGDAVVVSGTGAVGFGSYNTITNNLAFVAGDYNSASGSNDVVMGSYSKGQGFASVALGYYVGGCSNYSVALGYYAGTSSAPGYADVCGGTTHSGAFIFGDGSGAFFGTVANNEFAARASGGFRFRTSGDSSTGCNLPAGSGTFSCTSDRNLKNDFAPLDGEDVLQKLAAMPIETWSFLNEKNVRHAGPTAQDFYAAFKLGTDDTSIGLTDINGVALKGVQALEQRTRDLQNEVETLRVKLERLEKLLAQR